MNAGIVSMRAGFVLRSAEIHPVILRCVCFRDVYKPISGHIGRCSPPGAPWDGGGIALAAKEDGSKFDRFGTEKKKFMLSVV